MALREEMREEMTSDEAGLTVTWFGERLAAEEEGIFSGDEECRRRLCCLGVRAEVRGGMMGAGTEVLLMTGKCQTFFCRYGTQYASMRRSLRIQH